MAFLYFASEGDLARKRHIHDDPSDGFVLTSIRASDPSDNITCVLGLRDILDIHPFLLEYTQVFFL